MREMLACGNAFEMEGCVIAFIQTLDVFHKYASYLLKLWLY